MKLFTIILVVLISHLQYRLWHSAGSFAKIADYEAQLVALKQKTEDRKQRNDALYAEVEDLRQGQEALEERARNELGMIKSDETFFQIID